MIHDDELARKDELHRAQAARDILEHPLFKDAIEKLRNGLLDEIEKATVSETDKVRDAQRCLKLLSKLVQAINRHVTTGEMATAQLLEFNEQRKRLGLFRR